MNKKQKNIAISTVLLLLISGLFPPYAVYTFGSTPEASKISEFFSFNFIFAEIPSFRLHLNAVSDERWFMTVLQINFGIFAIEWVAILLVGFILVKVFATIPREL